MEIERISTVSPAQIAKFDCGSESLNLYLKRFAKKNDKMGMGRTYVLIEQGYGLGFYTLSMAHFEFHHLPESLKAKTPKYPIPAARIGRLAVDSTVQGRGLGQLLLMDALDRGLKVSEEIGLFAVIVDAKDAHAKKFYLKYGFISFLDQELSLFLPMHTLKQL